MKKIISIALFGDASKKDGSGQNYHAYLPALVLAHHNLFPREEGWELHVHVDSTTHAGRYGQILARMQEHGLVTLTDMGDAILTSAMIWRLSPIFCTDADVVFCRDIDALPMPRDRRACDEFIASGCVVHTVHDSSSHAGIMGGLCGFKSTLFKRATDIRSLETLYAIAKKTDGEWARHGTDQDVLNRLIDAPGSLTLLEHRYNGWHAGPGKHPPRGRGSYRCKAWSTPTPDKGSSRLSPELQAKADLLANHLGSAGYDIEAARAFWEYHGDAEITRLVRNCETGETT